MQKCGEGWKLFIDWCRASDAAWRRVTAAAPNATMSQLIDSQEETYSYQKTYTAYKNHLLVCPVCLAAIRAIDSGEGNTSPGGSNA